MVFPRADLPLAGLLDSLPEGCAILDEVGAFHFVNKQLEGWLGVPRDQLRGRPAQAHLGADLPPLLARVGGGETASLRVRIEPEGVLPRLLQLRLRPHRAGDGAVAGIFLRAVSVEDEEAAGAALTIHEIEEVQRVARIGSYRTDMKAGVWTASEGFCRLFGFEPGGVYTMDEFQAIVHPDEVESVMVHFGRCIAEHEPFDLEYRCIRRDTGEVIDVRSTSQILYDENGAPDLVIGIKQDITERRALERRLVAAQRMEAIGLLAGGVAHDFNNLLTAIQGFTELALELQPPAHRAIDHLREVLAGTNRARNLTGQLLAFSRRKTITPRVVDLNATVRGVDRLLRRIIGEDIDLRTVLDPELGRARIDPTALEQVIINLAVNARDAMPGGGTLTLETRNALLDAGSVELPGAEVEPGEYVVLAVSDSGEGMSEEVRARAFEPFFTTKSAGQGTGLGLSTCFGLVTQASGRISIYSEPGRGTTVKVYLPRTQQRADSTPARPEAAPLRGTETILVVEDDEAVRKLTRMALERQGYTVREAGGGEEALAILSDPGGPLDLLLTDVVMPGMGGRDLAEAAAELRPSLRVLYMSGYTADSIVHRGELAPGTALLHKPFNQAELAAKVREVLDGPRAP